MVAVVSNDSHKERQSSRPRFITPVSAAEKSIPVVPAPDEKTYKETTEAIRQVLNEWNIKIRGLTKMINDRSVGREAFDRKKSEFQTKLDEYQKCIESLEEERKLCMAKINEKSKEGREMKANLQNLKKSVGYKSEEEIEAKIEEIEYQLVTSTLSLKDEKKLLSQISQLKQSRPIVGRFAHMDASASSFEENSIIPLRAKIGSIIEDLNKLRKQKKEVFDKLRALTMDRQKALEPLRSLYDERSAMQSKVEEQHTKLRQLREEYDREMKLFMEYQGKLRALRSERVKEEKALRDLYRQRDDLKLALEQEDDPPISTEMQLVQQSLSYIQKLMESHGINDKNSEPKNEKGTSNEGNGPSLSTIKGRDKDESVLLPKNQRNEEYLIPPKGKKNKKKQNSASNNSGSQHKSLVVDFTTISTFEKVDLDVPLTTDDLPKAYSLLMEKHLKLKSDFDEKFANREKRKEEIMKKLGEVEQKITDAGGVIEDAPLSIPKAEESKE
ncbi:Brf1p-like coiled coil protein [Cryptosporidium canis]|uniref:Brf1p-like coiled coil protein n=1 Tax=Cryptosporidium canis TaxID=195482 RepID=A0A9D5DH22_9CRYT|nr:Brf1p-like coiled coil protein [Cryptosporidium canis]